MDNRNSFPFLSAIQLTILASIFTTISIALSSMIFGEFSGLQDRPIVIGGLFVIFLVMIWRKLGNSIDT